MPISTVQMSSELPDAQVPVRVICALASEGAEDGHRLSFRNQPISDYSDRLLEETTCTTPRVGDKAGDTETYGKRVTYSDSQVESLR